MNLPRDVKHWPELWRSRYEERAAIREYVGNMPRNEAEKITERDYREQAKGAK